MTGKHVCAVTDKCTGRVWIVIDVKGISRDVFQPIPTCRTHSRAAIDAALIHTRYPIIRRVD